MIRRRSRRSSSIEIPSRHRGTALLEMLLLLVPLISLALMSIALWKIGRTELHVAEDMHADVVRMVTKPSWGGDPHRADIAEWRYLPAGGAPSPSSPDYLSVAGFDNHLAAASERRVVHPRAGVFGRIGPVEIERDSVALRQAWTWGAGPVSFTQSARTTSQVRGWQQRALKESIGDVRRKLRMAD